MTKPLRDKILEAFAAGLDASTREQPYRRDNLLTTLAEALDTSLEATIFWDAMDSELGHLSLEDMYAENALDDGIVNCVTRAAHLPQIWVFREWSSVNGPGKIQIFGTAKEAHEAIAAAIREREK